MRRRTRAAAVAVLCAATALAGCAVPHQRDAGRIEKAASPESAVPEILDQYDRTRAAAVELLDPKPLSTVATGPVLAIDSGAFEVATAQKTTVDLGEGVLESTVIPRFGAYPLWLVAVVRDDDRGVKRLQVFERATAVDPWLLVESPEALADTAIPELRETRGGAVTVEPDDDRGTAMSAADAATAYARTLADPEAPEAATITADAFVQQMREAAQTNGSLEGVQFEQRWGADEVEHVLRTADGGALAFATLLRTDLYTVDADRRVTFPAGSPQQVFLSDGVQGTTGSLDYYHQVLIQLPPGKAKPRVIAQYGGVVRGGVESGATG